MEEDKRLPHLRVWTMKGVSQLEDSISLGKGQSGCLPPIQRKELFSSMKEPRKIARIIYQRTILSIILNSKKVCMYSIYRDTGNPCSLTSAHAYTHLCPHTYLSLSYIEELMLISSSFPLGMEVGLSPCFSLS